MPRRLPGRGLLPCLLVPVLAAGAVPVSPQSHPEAGTEVRPSSVRVGQPLQVRIHLPLPSGRVLVAPDSLPGLQAFHAAGPVDRTEPTGIGADTAWSLSYRLIPLRPGYRPLPALSLRLEEKDPASGGSSPAWFSIPLGGVQVLSVLPPPGEEIGPAPPMLTPGTGSKAVQLPLWLAAGGILCGGGWWIVRRRRHVPPGPPTAGTGRGEVRTLVRELEGLVARLPGSSEAMADLFEKAARLLRLLLEADLSRSLVGCTTPEVLVHLGQRLESEDLGHVGGALRTADRARFGVGPPTAHDLRTFRDQVTAWLGARRRLRDAGKGGSRG